MSTWEYYNNYIITTGSSPLTTVASEHLRREMLAHLVVVKKQQEADERAKQLFLNNLSPLQLNEFRSEKAITVYGISGNIYRIDCNHANLNITVLPGRRGIWNRFIHWANPDGAVYRICLIPREPVPFWDHMLMQKIILETNEKAALRI